MAAGSALKAPPSAGPRWSTTSYGDSADTRPLELTALGEHVSVCRADGRFGSLQRGAQVLHGLVATRFVTTLALAAALITALLLVF